MLNDQDYELLSAYIDGALTEAEQTTLEQRLQADSALRRELDGLQETVNLIRALPPMQAPRNFTLTPRMVRSARWLIFPTTTAFSALSAAAAVLLMAFGALLLFNNQATAPLPASNFQQVAAAPTEISATTAVEEQELSAASTTMELPAAPPQAAQGVVGQAETTGNAAGESALSAESEGFIETEVLATEGAMMMYAAPQGTQPPIDPAQDAQTFVLPETMPAMGGAAPGEDDFTADSAMAAIASSLTATPGAARENLTATLMLPTASSTPTDTPTPTATLTPPPSPTATSVPKASAPTISSDLLPIGAFVAGIALLAIAFVTTWIRRRR